MKNAVKKKAPVASISFASKEKQAGVLDSELLQFNALGGSEANARITDSMEAESDWSSETSSLSGDEGMRNFPLSVRRGFPESVGHVMTLVIKCDDGTRLAKINLHGDYEGQPDEDDAGKFRNEVIVIESDGDGDEDLSNCPSRARARPTPQQVTPSPKKAHRKRSRNGDYDSAQVSPNEGINFGNSRKKMSPREQEIISTVVDIPAVINESPYEPDEHAEEGEPLFDQLKQILLPASQQIELHQAPVIKNRNVSALFDSLTPSASPESTRQLKMRGTRRIQPSKEAIDVFGSNLADTMVTSSQAILSSHMLYGSTWKLGEFTKAKCKPLPLPMLTICLQEMRLWNAFDVNILDIMVADLQIYDLVARLLDEWDMCELFPRLSDLLEPNKVTKKRTIPMYTAFRLECHKCAIFVARAFVTVEVLKPESINMSLTEKIESCLAIMSRYADDSNLNNTKLGRSSEHSRKRSRPIATPKVQHFESSSDEDFSVVEVTSQPIELLTKSGLLLKRFGSIEEARIATGIDEIKIKSNFSSAPNFWWRYAGGQSRQRTQNAAEPAPPSSQRHAVGKKGRTNPKSNNADGQAKKPRKGAHNLPPIHAKGVEKLDLKTGELVQSYKSITAATKENNLPINRLGARLALEGFTIYAGFFWRHAGSDALPDPGAIGRHEATATIKDTDDQDKDKIWGHMKPVEQFCATTGALLKRYPSLKAASRNTRLRPDTLSDIINYGPNTYKGSVWRWATDDGELDQTPVERYCFESGELIKRYPNVRDASRDMASCLDELRDIVANGPKYFRRCIWQYANNEESAPSIDVSMFERPTKKPQKKRLTNLDPPIEQLSMGGQVLNTFDSKDRVMSTFDLTHKGLQSLMQQFPTEYDGFFWRFAGSDALPEPSPDHSGSENDEESVSSSDSRVQNEKPGLSAVTPAPKRAKTDGGVVVFSPGGKLILQRRGRKSAPVEQSCLQTGRVIEVFSSMRQAILKHSFKRSAFHKAMEESPVDFEGFRWRLIGKEEIEPPVRSRSKLPPPPPETERVASSHDSAKPRYHKEEESDDETQSEVRERSRIEKATKSIVELHDTDGGGFDDGELQEDEGALENKHFPNGAIVYPGDDDDTILAASEIEVAWLVEESRYCYDQDEIQWNFVFQNASPSLKVELRKMSNQDEPLNDLVRKDAQVAERFASLRTNIHVLLRDGHSRDSMAHEIRRAQTSRRKVLSGLFNRER